MTDKHGRFAVSPWIPLARPQPVRWNGHKWWICGRRTTYLHRQSWYRWTLCYDSAARRYILVALPMSPWWLNCLLRTTMSWRKITGMKGACDALVTWLEMVERWRSAQDRSQPQITHRGECWFKVMRFGLFRLINGRGEWWFAWIWRLDCRPGMHCIAIVHWVTRDDVRRLFI